MLIGSKGNKLKVGQKRTSQSVHSLIEWEAEPRDQAQKRPGPGRPGDPDSNRKVSFLSLLFPLLKIQTPASKHLMA